MGGCYIVSDVSSDQMRIFLISKALIRDGGGGGIVVVLGLVARVDVENVVTNIRHKDKMSP